jgi:hypothetical protein
MLNRSQNVTTCGTLVTGNHSDLLEVYFKIYKLLYVEGTALSQHRLGNIFFFSDTQQPDNLTDPLESKIFENPLFLGTDTPNKVFSCKCTIWIKLPFSLIHESWFMPSILFKFTIISEMMKLSVFSRTLRLCMSPFLSLYLHKAMPCPEHIK